MENIECCKWFYYSMVVPARFRLTLFPSLHLTELQLPSEGVSVATDILTLWPSV